MGDDCELCASDKLIVSDCIECVDIICDVFDCIECTGVWIGVNCDFCFFDMGGPKCDQFVFMDLFVAYGSVCGLRFDGSVICWGSNGVQKDIYILFEGCFGYCKVGDLSGFYLGVAVFGGVHCALDEV